METLTKRDDRRIRQFKERLKAVPSKTEFIGELVTALSTVISADVISYNEVTPNLRMAAYMVWPPNHPEIPDALKNFGRYAHQNPLVTYAAQSNSIEAHKITNFISHQKFCNTDHYNEFHRPLQLPYNMAVKVTPSNTSSIAVSFLRSQRDFSSHDTTLLNGLRKHIMRAYKLVTMLTEMQNDEAVNHETIGTRCLSLIEVTREGRIRLSSPTSESILATYAGGTKHAHGYLPPHICEWLRHEINQEASDSDVHRLSDPLRINRPRGTLMIHLHSQGQHPLLLLEEVHVDVSEIKLCKLSLTSREKEIWDLLIQGKTNPEIGDILDVSPGTVKKHLQSAYRKRGVETRYAAMCQALSSD